jgi:hypothetical protein
MNVHRLVQKFANFSITLYSNVYSLRAMRGLKAGDERYTLCKHRLNIIKENNEEIFV